MSPSTNQKGATTQMPTTSGKPQTAEITHLDAIFAKNSADLLGITNLDPQVAAELENISRKAIKETLRLAVKWTGRCARRKMTVQDVENTIRMMQSTGNVKLTSVDTINTGIQQLTAVAGTSAGIYSFQKVNGDLEVDKEDSESGGLIPRDLRIISYELVNQGQPVQSEYTLNVDEEDGTYFDKNAPDTLMVPAKEESSTLSSGSSCLQMFRETLKNAKVDQKVGLKPSSAEILTLEQQIFMKEIITVCMGQDDKKRLEALHTLETDAGIQILLPYLIERICKSISANISQRCLSLIIYATRVIRSLSYNKACDITVSLHHVIPALLSCCLGRNICLRPDDNHWALRDFAAKTLVGLIRDQLTARDCLLTSRRLFEFSYRIFKNQNSSFPMIYGTLLLLQEFLTSSHKSLNFLISEMSEMTMRCKTHVEAHSRMGIPPVSVQEAQRLIQQIMKCENTLRSRLGPQHRRFIN